MRNETVFIWAAQQFRRQQSGLRGTDRAAFGGCERGADLKGCSWLLALEAALRLKVTAAAAMFGWWWRRREPLLWSCLWLNLQGGCWYSNIFDIFDASEKPRLAKGWEALTSSFFFPLFGACEWFGSLRSVELIIVIKWSVLLPLFSVECGQLMARKRRETRGEKNETMRVCYKEEEPMQDFFSC